MGLYTGKEHDNENNYDYFGARYYDSRIGRWGGVDPQTSKNPGWTPYRAFLDNPINILDPSGGFELSKEFMKKYPKLSYLVQYELPKLVENKNVINALKEWTTLSQEQIIEDFSWGSGPKINVKSLPGAWGSFNYQVDPNVINIKEILVSDLQNSEGDVEEVLNFFTGIVLMHEYTHYGTNKAGLVFFQIDEKGNIIGREEEGLRFEETVYGSKIGGPDVAAKKMNESIKNKGISKTYPTDIEKTLDENRNK